MPVHPTLRAILIRQPLFLLQKQHNDRQDGYFSALLQHCRLEKIFAESDLGNQEGKSHREFSRNSDECHGLFCIISKRQFSAVKLKIAEPLRLKCSSS